MKIISKWKLFLDAKSEKRSTKILDKVSSLLRRDIRNEKVESSPETGGYAVMFEVDMKSSRWNDAVVEVIELGQKIGDGWTLNGSVMQDPQGWSNRPSGVAGIISISWILSEA